jgi:hypothetical protein
MVELLVTFVIHQKFDLMLDLHSIVRWALLLFLVLAVLKSFAGWFGKKPFGKGDNIIAIILVSFTHIQALIGLALYFMNSWHAGLSNMGVAMKDATMRFWTLEHLVVMLMAVVFITMGRAKSKKGKTDEIKHKKGAIFYTLALLLILWAGLIKPYALGRGWI